MSRLIDADKLILHMNDWGLSIAPDERTPDIAKEYTAKDMAKMEYRTIQTAMQVVEELPTVEAIPKDQYEQRLKADMAAMLKDLQLEIENLDAPDCDSADNGCLLWNQVDKELQSRIDALEGGS